jgi:hypothetical protein
MQSSLDRIWTVYPLNDGKLNPAGYGFAWTIGLQNGHKLIAHGGAWQGFTCDISRYPDDSLSVVVLTNLDAGHARPGLFASVIAGLAYAPLMPKKLAAIEDTQPALVPVLRKLLDRLAAGEDIRDQTSPTLTAQMPPARMKNIQKFLSTIWPGGTLTLVQRDSESGALLSVYRLSKPGGDTRLIYFSLARDGKIGEFSTSPDREYR